MVLVNTIIYFPNVIAELYSIDILTYSIQLHDSKEWCLLEYRAETINISCTGKVRHESCELYIAHATAKLAGFAC